MAQYNGVHKDKIVNSIDDMIDLILRDDHVSPLERPIYDWIDGRKLAIRRQSSSDEELARNMDYTGANKIFAVHGQFLLRLEFNDLAEQDRRAIETLKEWNAFKAPKNSK